MKDWFRTCQEYQSLKSQAPYTSCHIVCMEPTSIISWALNDDLIQYKCCEKSYTFWCLGNNDLPKRLYMISINALLSNNFNPWLIKSAEADHMNTKNHGMQLFKIFNHFMEFGLKYLYSLLEVIPRKLSHQICRLSSLWGVRCKDFSWMPFYWTSLKCSSTSSQHS